MDAQLKKGLLDVCVLSSLSRHDSYGYQIVKDVSNVIEISESTLYPLLKRLETAGALETYSIAHNGRLRKYYRITPIGYEKIQDFITSWPEMEAIHEFVKGGISHEKS